MRQQTADSRQQSISIYFLNASLGVAEDTDPDTDADPDTDPVPDPISPFR
jgi:hypothetical protein